MRLKAMVSLVVTVGVLGLSPGAEASGWSVTLHSGSTGESHSQAKPSAPGSVSAACASSFGATIKVSWNAVSHASTYTVYESTTSSSSGYSVVGSGVTTTTWTSATLAAATYWFEVAAIVGTHWASSNSAAAGPRTIGSGPTCS